MYGKLINGALKNAPNIIKLNGKQIINPREDKLLLAGYLPVEYTDAPAVEEGYYAVDSFTERNGKIVQVWTINNSAEEKGIKCNMSL